MRRCRAPGLLHNPPKPPPFVPASGFRVRVRAKVRVRGRVVGGLWAG